jgi:hypothetical protein
VSHFFWADHRAGHPGALQHTLSAHTTIKEDSFSHLFKSDKEPLDSTAKGEPRVKWLQDPFGQVVGEL